jgi:hypothetical protein
MPHQDDSRDRPPRSLVGRHAALGFPATSRPGLESAPFDRHGRLSLGRPFAAAAGGFSRPDGPEPADAPAFDRSHPAGRRGRLAPWPDDRSSPHASGP